MELTKRTIFGGICALATSVVAVAGGIAYADPRQSKVELAAASITAGLYTQNFSRPAQATILRLRLDQMFDDGERAAIQRAAAEWNHVLNGYIRFEVEVIPIGRPAPPYEPGLWTVVRIPREADPPARRPAMEALAATLGPPKEGGLVAVFVDRLIGVELSRVMLHEFGHALGLDHNPRSHLMASRYVEDEHKCIDKATVELVAAHWNLPLNELNWCTAQNKVWSSYRDENWARPPASRSRVAKAS